jgi:hypothetical protein
MKAKRAITSPLKLLWQEISHGQHAMRTGRGCGFQLSDHIELHRTEQNSARLKLPRTTLVPGHISNLEGRYSLAAPVTSSFVVFFSGHRPRLSYLTFECIFIAADQGRITLRQE